jgi:hypothetical protein
MRRRRRQDESASRLAALWLHTTALLSKSCELHDGEDIPWHEMKVGE